MKKEKKFKFFIKNKYTIFICKFLLLIITILIIFYFLFGVLLYKNTDRFVYHPNKEDFYSCQDFFQFSKIEFNNTRFYFSENLNSSSVIIYYHGNGGSACDKSFLGRFFTRTRKNVIFVEYSGYANDSRKPNKELLLSDVNNIQKFIENKNITNIITMGDSLGTAFASYQSTLSKNVTSIILIAPFDTNQHLAYNTYLKFYPKIFYDFDNYNNIKYLENYTNNLTIIHGTNDTNIPIEYSINLFNSSISKNKKMEIVEGASHHNLFNYMQTYITIWNEIK